MSNSSPPNEAVRSYLIAQLQRDPAQHAPAIMRARTRELKLDKEKGSAVDVAVQRKRWNKAKESLDALRKRIWTAPLAELEQELTKLPTARFPDVTHAAERLRIVLANRDKLPALTQHKDFWVDFFNVFKEVLVAPPQEVGVLRERCVGMFRQRAVHRKGSRMIELLAREIPVLYELESDWLSSLKRQKSSRIVLSSVSSEKAALPSSAEEISIPPIEWIKLPPGWYLIMLASLTIWLLSNLFGEK